MSAQSTMIATTRDTLSRVWDLDVRVDDLGSIRSYRDGRIIGVVDVRDGKIVHAEHTGKVWWFWRTDSQAIRNRKVRQWRDRVLGGVPA